MTPDPPRLVLQPLVHVADVAQTVRFFEALGAALVSGSRDGDFALMRLGGAEIGVLGHPPNPDQHEGDVELNFSTRGDLHALERELASTGVRIVRGTTDEAFGKQLQIAMPDGMLVKINMLDPTTYE